MELQENLLEKGSAALIIDHNNTRQGYAFRSAKFILKLAGYLFLALLNPKRVLKHKGLS